MANPDVQNRQAFDYLFDTMNEVISDTFYEAVQDRMGNIQDRLSELSREFFKEFSGHIGINKTPGFVSEYGYGTWDDLKAEWLFQKNAATDNSNRFYSGLTGNYQSQIAALNAEKILGKPTVTVGRGEEVSGESIGVKFDPKVNRARDSRGRFTRRLETYYEAEVNYRLFSKVAPGPGAADRMINLLPSGLDGDLNIKIAAGEYGSKKWNRPARPFLLPFFDFYTDTKVYQTVMREAR